jgi:two-component system, NtrC family, sensor kinase
MSNSLDSDQSLNALQQAAYQLSSCTDQIFLQIKLQEALTRVVDRIRSSLDLDTLFNTTATEIRELLNADRVGVFRFEPDSGWDDGEFVAEDVAANFSSALAEKVHDHCFGSQFATYYTQGRVQAVADIHDAGLSDCHIQVLKQFQIRANLIVPVLKGKELWGLLCIHQCAHPRRWQLGEVEFVQKIAGHFAIALQQAESLGKIQAQAIELKQALADFQQSQVQLIQNEKMASLGQLVAGVAHEINNPVNFIHGNLTHVAKYMTDLLTLAQFYQQQDVASVEDVQRLQVLVKDMDIPFILEDLPKTFASMQMGTERIRNIVLSLRNFSRLDEADFKAVDIREGIDSTLLILGSRIKDCGHQQAVEIIKNYADIPRIESYPAQLNQVFMHLLNNALDAIELAIKAETLTDETAASAQPHKIWISTQLNEKEQVEIRIRDSGIGLDERVASKVFDHFFTTKPVGKGIGLGLSISRKIIMENHFGTLDLNATPDQGAEFIVCLPVKLSSAIN